MANVTLSWKNPAADAGGTPSEYRVYRANGNTTPSYNSSNTNLNSSVWSSITQTSAGNVIPVPHTSAGADTTVTDTTASSGQNYTYAVIAYNAAGLGLPNSPTAVPYKNVTA
jgi:hypothetical protein